MQFNYVMSRKDFKKHLKNEYFRSSVLYVALFSLFFGVISFSYIKFNFWLVFINYLIYMFALCVIISLINRVFIYIILKISDKDNEYGRIECQIDDKQITQKINDKEYVLNWDDIIKLKQTKRYIMLVGNNQNFIILFKKDFFKDKELYSEIVELIKKQRNTEKELEN